MFWYGWQDTWDIMENFAAILFIAVNRWVSCDVTMSITQLNTGVPRGAVPPGWRKNRGGFTRENVSAPPRQSKSPFFRKLGGGRGHLDSFSVCFEGDDQKGSSTFRGRKVDPRQNPGYAYDWTPWFGSAVLRSSGVSSANSSKWRFFFVT